MRLSTCTLFAALLAAGCAQTNPYGASVHAVGGKLVGPAGERVRGGAEVLFIPKSTGQGVFGKEGSALVQPDGSFAVKTADGEDGLPGGTYLVVVRPYGAKATSEKQTATRVIPKKYWLEETTDLVVEVTDAKTGWDLKLAR